MLQHENFKKTVKNLTGYIFFYRYKFKLKFTKGERNDYAFITVIVKSGAPPSAFIYPSKLAKVNPTDVLIIESFISSKKTVNTTWSCVLYEGNCERYVTLYRYIDHLNTSFLLQKNRHH